MDDRSGHEINNTISVSPTKATNNTQLIILVIQSAGQIWATVRRNHFKHRLAHDRYCLIFYPFPFLSLNLRYLHIISPPLIFSPIGWHSRSSNHTHHPHIRTTWRPISRIPPVGARGTWFMISSSWPSVTLQVFCANMHPKWSAGEIIKHKFTQNKHPCKYWVLIMLFIRSIPFRDANSPPEMTYMSSPLIKKILLKRNNDVFTSVICKPLEL